jgi:hypothetical protein
MIGNMLSGNSGSGNIALYSNPTPAQKALSALVTRYAQLTPKYYFDSSLTTGNGNGLSEANAFKTAAELNAVLPASGTVSPSDAYAGAVLAFKRGTIIREQIKLSPHAPKERPFTITAYGSGELPIIDLSVAVTDWVASANPLIFTSPTTPNATPLWQGTSRYRALRPGSAPVTVATAISEAAAAGAGYCSYADDGNIYIYPLTANPNTADIRKPAKSLGTDASNTGVGLYIFCHASNSIYRTSGNVHITNMAVRYCLHSSIKVEFASTSNLTYTRIAPKIFGCSLQNSGIAIQDNDPAVSANAGNTPPGDAILLNGYDSTTKAQRGRIAGNYFYDTGNNAIETSNTNRLLIEWNYSRDQLGHLVEHWAANENAVTRYNISDCRGIENLPVLNAALFGKGLWNFAATTPTNLVLDPAGSKNCTYAFNACIGGKGESFQDNGAQGTKCYNNTFVNSTNYNIAPVISINSPNTTATLARIDFSNNVIVSTHATAAKVEYFRTGSPSNTVITGSNNRVSRTFNQAMGDEIQGSATLDVYAINTGSITDYTTSAAFATAHAASGMTNQFSYNVAAALDPNGWPSYVSDLCDSVPTFQKATTHVITGKTTALVAFPSYTWAKATNIWTGTNIFNNGSAFDVQGNTQVWLNGVLQPTATVTSTSSITLPSTPVATDFITIVINPELDFYCDLNGDPLITGCVGAYQNSPLLVAYDSRNGK